MLQSKKDGGRRGGRGTLRLNMSWEKKVLEVGRTVICENQSFDGDVGSSLIFQVRETWFLMSEVHKTWSMFGVGPFGAIKVMIAV
mmetsp:Transcript_30793/g.73959  ORF Transcript_30793/g.73959 Transcript_30793/m.73959 type:complete len:85 (-) Transcript_30793:1214-1468(-)